MTFERIKDYALVRQILTDPGIYRYMTDDFAPAREQFTANEHPAIRYILAIQGTKLAGMFCFFPENEICWQAHVAMLRRVPPAVTYQAGREVVEWLWEHTNCLRLNAAVPAYHRAAVRFGQQAMGLTVFGRDEKSFMKNAKLQDRILMGRSRPGV